MPPLLSNLQSRLTAAFQNRSRNPREVNDRRIMPELSPIGALSTQGAERLFDSLLSMTSSRAWDRLAGGCESRAEVVAGLVENAGGLTFKVWAFPPLEGGKIGRPLTPRRQQPTSSSIHTWHFHVAAAALVLDGGKISIRIFDPSLFNGHCEPSRWMWGLSATKGRMLMTMATVLMLDPETLAFSGRPGDNIVDNDILHQAMSPDTEMPRLPCEF